MNPFRALQCFGLREHSPYGVPKEGGHRICNLSIRRCLSAVKHEIIGEGLNCRQFTNCHPSMIARMMEDDDTSPIVSPGRNSWGGLAWINKSVPQITVESQLITRTNVIRYCA